MSALQRVTADIGRIAQQRLNQDGARDFCAKAGQPGTITLKATADGLTEAVICIRSR
jgi:hypothetical protein